MTRVLKSLAVFLLALTLINCSDDDEPTTKDLKLTINGLENLGNDYVYEGWIMVNGSPKTTGRFTVDDNGNLSQTSFLLDISDVNSATAFILTIEKAVGDVPEPSSVHILAGDFLGNSGQLTIDHEAALGNNFATASGKYILATPTDGGDTNENSGIWFLDLSSGMPSVGLNLPTLPVGWKYEGWVVSGGIPITTGKFTMVDMVDDFDEYSSTMYPGPSFPGEDFLMNAPTGLNFPLDLAGGTAVISIEPDPDNSSMPFLLKPLVGDIPTDALDHITYSLGQNLNFPIGTVLR